jgi:hypothetical protein
MFFSRQNKNYVGLWQNVSSISEVCDGYLHTSMIGHRVFRTLSPLNNDGNQGHDTKWRKGTCWSCFGVHSHFFCGSGFGLNGGADEPANWPKPRWPGANLGGANGPKFIAEADGMGVDAAASVTCPPLELPSARASQNTCLALSKNSGVPLSKNSGLLMVVTSVRSLSVSRLHSGACACLMMAPPDGGV